MGHDMINRAPLYIKLNNSIVDLSQITVIQSVDITGDVNQHRIHMYIGKEMAFSFLFSDQESKDAALRDIQDLLEESYTFKHTGAYEAEDDNPDADEN